MESNESGMKLYVFETAHRVTSAQGAVNTFTEKKPHVQRDNLG